MIITMMLKTARMSYENIPMESGFVSSPSPVTEPFPFPLGTGSTSTGSSDNTIVIDSTFDSRPSE